ncbi:MAG TPA: ferrochelatase [Myxococcota bacterium]|nr:ferrochelatase [Myxococcota bacterium]HQK51948.1 ferrochelatase [Myxococcota bacterium]
MTPTLVVLLQMGGPASLDQVRPFLEALLSDPAILRMPGVFRRPLARWIARRRAPAVTEVYRRLGGGSPIGPLTEAQARGLQQEMARRGIDVPVRVAMRYVSPRAEEVLQEAVHLRVRRLVLLPLYPQFSTTTTGSSRAEFRALASRVCPEVEVREVEDYPDHPRYVEALAEQVRRTLDSVPRDLRDRTRILWSAHGLPMRHVRSGDPYPERIHRTVAAVEALLAQEGPIPPGRIGWQSRVGPVQWLGPSTEEVVREEGRRGTGALVVVPVSFVSEHLETLYELDVLVRQVAADVGIMSYHRVPALNDHPRFLQALADLVQGALA